MPESAVVISEVTELTDEIADAIRRLLPQLSTTATGAEKVLRAVVEAPSSTLLVAENDLGIVGMCTLATMLIPTGVRCWIEDVVVDEAARGQGVGSLLVEAALEQARAQGAKNVDLTSRPERIAANRLYQRLGFKERPTNVYRHSLEE